MSVETLPLPRFQTERGVLIDVPADLPDLRYGFVLDEAVTDQDVTNIHTMHRQAAQVFLSCAGLVAAPVSIVEEFPRHKTRDYSPPHMDGLAGPYYQVNTVHPSDEGQHSRMMLSMFDLDADEHEAMQVLRVNGFGSTHGHGVDFHPAKPGMFFGAIAPALGNRQPDSRWSADACPNSTIVFPNGYDAGLGSLPGKLFVHQFSTIEMDDHEGPRTVSLSRIEPAAA